MTESTNILVFFIVFLNIRILLIAAFNNSANYQLMSKYNQGILTSYEYLDLSKKHIDANMNNLFLRYLDLRIWSYYQLYSELEKDINLLEQAEEFNR